MREIKFRGQTTDSKAWVYGFLVRRPSAVQVGNTSPYAIIVPPCDPDDCGGEYRVIPETIGQFTGLCDKNGVEIYEGDIVKYNDRETAEVTYQPSEYMLVFKSQEVPQRGLLCESWKNNFEVIGNIHERKEEK